MTIAQQIRGYPQDSTAENNYLVVNSDGSACVSGVVNIVSPTENNYSVITIDLAHHKIHDGDHFFVKGWGDVANAASVNFLWVIGSSGDDVPHALYEFVAEGEFEWQLFEGTTYSDAGSAIIIQNNNRNSSKTSMAEAYIAPTITNAGTIIASGIIGSSNKAGGEHREDDEIDAKINTAYLFRFTNNSGQTKWLDWKFAWYEHPTG